MTPLVEWRPGGGIDKNAYPIAVPPDRCANARNFIFERGVARTRPHAQGGYANYNSGGKVDFAKSLILPDRVGRSLYILDTGAVYKGSTQVTGAGTNFGDKEYHNISTVNGTVLIGNNIGGVLEHDPASSTYTVNANAKYRYFTSSRSRAFGANDITNAAEDPRKVAWTVTGDETDWTGTGSGTATLTEIPDGITGLANIENVVVIMRDTGITLAYLTGTGTSPFRFDTAVRDGAGCPWPATLASYNNQLFYVGPDDVYTYRLRQAPSPIGMEVRDEVHMALARGQELRGFVTRNDRRQPMGGIFTSTAQLTHHQLALPRLRYHLVSTSGPGLHFCYDVEEQKWSIHTYRFAINTGYEQIGASSAATGLGNHPLFTPTLVDNSIGGLEYWWFDKISGPTDDSLIQPFGDANLSKVDEESFIESPTIVVGDPSQDYDVSRVLLSWALDAPVTKDNGAMVDIEVHYKEKYKPRSSKVSRSLADLDSSESWQRTFYDLKLTGNYFRIKVTVPQSIKLAVDRIQLLGDHAAEARNSAYE